MWAILRDDAEAEEAVQDAYLQAFQAIATYRAEAKLSTWLVRVVANKALERRRKDVRRAAILPMSSRDAEPGALDESATPESAGPERETQRAELRKLLERRIDELPDAYRAVFVLRALEEFTVEETAAALGIPEATVRTRFFRARSQLREALSLEIDFALDEAFSFLGERCDRIVARVLASLAEAGFRPAVP